MVYPKGRSRPEVPPADHQHHQSRHTGSETDGLAIAQMSQGIGKGRYHPSILSSKTGVLLQEQLSRKPINSARWWRWSEVHVQATQHGPRAIAKALGISRMSVHRALTRSS